jgi:hypothetical protein
MAEYKHGSMDVSAQEAMFASFMKFMARSVIVILAVLVFLAVFFS